MSDQTTTIQPTETAPVVAPETPAAPILTAPADQTPQDRDEQGRFRNPVQPRIDELTRKARENEREASYWKSLAMANQAPAPAEVKKPEPGDYQDYGQFVEALADFKAEEKIGKALKEHDEKTTRKAAETTRAQTWNERQGQTRTTTPDYDAVVANSDVPVSKHVGELLLESEYGPQVAYMLAKNPQVAERLNSLAPLQAAREMGRIEATFSGPGSAPAVASAPAVRTTNAPPPARPVPQSSSTLVDMSKLSTEAYVAQRKKDGASWAR
jgi:hypothetical protein